MMPCPECGGSDARTPYVGLDRCPVCGQQMPSILQSRYTTNGEDLPLFFPKLNTGETKETKE